jgi:hypothetical protein
MEKLTALADAFIDQVRNRIDAVKGSKLHAALLTGPEVSYADNRIMHLCDMHLSKVAFH